MRSSVLFAACVTLFATSFSALAGRLDIAVLQFSDARDPASIAEALTKVDLLKVTNSDRTETNVPGLRAGNVIFVQSLPISSGGSFASSTRLGIQRADVSGTLNGSNLAVQISIKEGVKVGLRKFRETIYEGSGSVAGPFAKVLSVRQSQNKSMTVVKNRSQTISYELTSVVVAQYTP